MTIFEDTATAFKLKSNQELKKAHLLFKAVDKNWLTNFGAWSWPIAIHLPGVKAIIKNTVFAQFCGGETRKESLDTVEQIYQQGVKSILDYSVEGKEEEAEYERCFNEIMQIIDIATNNPMVPFVVFKPTGFGNIDIYTKVSEKKPLNDNEQNQWNNIQRRFEAVCQKGFENEVLITIDAEESWMQDAVDDLILEMIRKFNKDRVVVINTLQMYRHDRLAYLKNQCKLAEKEGFYLGYKIVRGAYMEKERERAKEKGYESPIHPDKTSTDKDYNSALQFICAHLDRVSLFAGTHNERSCEILMNLIEEYQKPKNFNKIWFGQLLGMSDNISFVLGDIGYNVAKYVPYGPIKDVMPYLIRRARENTSVAGQSSRELGLIEKELRRRKLEH